MPIIINGESIPDYEILNEMERMRPDYEKAFAALDIIEKEYQLLEWAKENVIERILLRQEALKDPDPVPSNIIEQRFLSLVQIHKGQESFLRSRGLTENDIPFVKKQIETQLQIEKFFDKTTGIKNDSSEEEKQALLNQCLDQLKKKASIEFTSNDLLELEVERTIARKKMQSGYTKPLNSLLVKPAGPDCNMACDYCFYLEKIELFKDTPIHRMSDDTLQEMMKQAMTQSEGHIGFGWQGGEPTLMGVDFFKKTVHYQKQYGKNHSVSNSLQTNGLLIDSEWAEFLKENEFLVGLSLDGPRHIHDHYRKQSGGQPSWEKVMAARDLLLKSEVQVNALTVVNDYSVQYPEEIYRFHKETGLTYMQFIPCVETDKDDSSKAASFSVQPEEYGEFLITLFDLWQGDFKNGRPTTFVRFFDSVFYIYTGYSPPDCTLMETCGHYLVVEHNGDVFPCDFFVEDTLKLGNLHENRLQDLLNSKKQIQFGSEKQNIVQKCKDCPWLMYCRGGCPKDRIRDPQDKGLFHFCKSYQMFFDHAHDHLKALAERWKQENQNS